ncbi:hypothetical protein GCM10027285_29410 [Oleiagrimonas citrea]
MAGTYCVDVFGEASASPEGHIIVDFLCGSTSGSPVSSNLRQAIVRFSERLPKLAKEHGIEVSEIKTMSARFGTDPILGRHFAVTVETSDGRKSVDQYTGTPGKRYSKPRRSKGEYRGRGN